MFQMLNASYAHDKLDMLDELNGLDELNMLTLDERDEMDELQVRYNVLILDVMKIGRRSPSSTSIDNYSICMVLQHRFGAST